MPTRRLTRAMVESRAQGAHLDRIGVAVTSPLITMPLPVPLDIRLGDTPEGLPAILWRWPPPTDEYGLRHAWNYGGTSAQAFWSFLDLADEPRASAFLAFAKRYGVLGLWPYETVDGHRIFGLNHWVPSVTEGVMTPDRYVILRSDERYEIERQGLLGMMYEPIAEWKQWATWFRAVVLIAFELRNDRIGTRSNWAALGWDFAFDPARYKDSSRFISDVAMQRDTLVHHIQDRFLKWSGLVPVVQWSGKSIALTISLGGNDAVQVPQRGMRHDWPENCLFPALVVQLLATLTAGVHIAACSFPGCGRLHQRTRKPRPDQPASCDECRPIAERERKRAWAYRARSAVKAEENPSAPLRITRMINVTPLMSDGCCSLSRAIAQSQLHISSHHSAGSGPFEESGRSYPPIS